MGARTIPVITLVAALILPTAGCSRQISDKNIELVDATDASELIEGRQRLFGLAGTASATFVDPRSARRYREGHIPGAISLPFQNLSTESARLEAYDVLIIYGNGYDDELAFGMSKRLMELGFKDVRTLHGGLQAWTAAGNDVETGE